MATKGRAGPGDQSVGPNGTGDRSVGRKGWKGVSPPVLRVSAGEGDAVHWIMAAKEEPVKRREGESHPEIGVPRAYV